MRSRWRSQILFVFLAGASVTHVLAQNSPLTFESFVDSATLTNQYAGATFTNSIFLTAGITLDEFEFPPHGGANVASDNGGPITITFESPVRSFSGYFTYSVPVSVQAFDSGNQALTSASSAHSNNQALSGVSGSHPNELLQVSSATGISKIVITGGAQGASFTVDDLTVITRCDLDQDGMTTAKDAQAMVNEALGTAAASDRLTAGAGVNLVDVQIVINAALSRGCAAN